MSNKAYQKNGDIQGLSIYGTRDYERFSFDPSNRPIDQRHLERLYDVISKNNLLHVNPILVTEDFVVRDGQHRLRVAESLLCPIYYFVSNDVAQEYVPRMNEVGKDWTSKDALHHYTYMQVPDYLKLQEFMDRYSWMTISTASQITGTVYTGDEEGITSFQSGFKSGYYVADKLQAGRKVASHALDFREVGVKHYSHHRFLTALQGLMASPRYDINIMRRKLELIPTRVTRAGSIHEQIEVLLNVYNHLQRANTLAIDEVGQYGGKVRKGYRETVNA